MNAHSLRNVLIKAILLFLGLNLLFAATNPMPALGRASIYNTIVPGRTRLPFGENPEKAYNLSLFNLDAMFASHELDGTPKAPDEYRVLVIGDSSVWGFLLTNEDTLTAYLNREYLRTNDGRKLRFYNLGYPTISLTKDLLILDYAMRYEPDLILWLVTLESFPYEKQVFTPLVQNNPEPVRDLIARYSLKVDPQDPAFVDPTFWQRTITGQRRPLADWLRLQLYGPLWAATGIDQDIPETYEPRAKDLEADESYYGLIPPLTESDLAFDVLAAGVTRAGDVPVLIVNEPMFVSEGENSDIRYNFFYPRWAYDAYRELFAAFTAQNPFARLDLWQSIPNTEYTNSAIHLTPRGSAYLATLLTPTILRIANR